MDFDQDLTRFPTNFGFKSHNLNEYLTCVFSFEGYSFIYFIIVIPAYYCCVLSLSKLHSGMSDTHKWNFGYIFFDAVYYVKTDSLQTDCFKLNKFSCDAKIAVHPH